MYKFKKKSTYNTGDQDYFLVFLLLDSKRRKPKSFLVITLYIQSLQIRFNFWFAIKASVIAKIKQFATTTIDF